MRSVWRIPDSCRERIKNLSQYVGGRRTIIVTDDTVAGIYGRDFPEADVIRIGTGESIKTIETAADIYQQLIGLEADRSVFLLGIGGGIVCDITGFVASTYLRGVDFGYVPTTLLAQVDASVGGKTGVNFAGYKNMVGVFSQPAFVLCDPFVLKSFRRRCLPAGLRKLSSMRPSVMWIIFYGLKKPPSGPWPLNRK